MDQIEGAQSPETLTPEEQPSAPAEKMLTQTEVNQLIKLNKQLAHKKGREEAIAELRATQSQPVQQATHPNIVQHAMGGMPAVTEDQVRQIFADQAHKYAQEEYNKNLVNNLANKIISGKSKYDAKEFDKVLDELQLDKMGPVVKLMGESNIDNVADVLVHLHANPNKLAALEINAEKRPNVAQRALQDLASSLKQNEAAQNTPKIPEPIGQIKTSTVGADNKKLTAADYRVLFRKKQNRS